MDDRPAAALSAQGLTHRFGARMALEDVSLDVHAGELVAVIGPNGAGKTTLLSLLAGVLSPSGGSVRRPAGRRSVGWVPQQPALYSRLTVTENLELFARLERRPDPRRSAAAMLEQAGLAERADELVSRLSGGNQQRVNIAIGLLGEPAVLLLDEPSSSLDPRQRERLWEFIVALAGRGTGVVYSAHDLLEARRHADRVAALDAGRLVYSGPPAGMEWEL